MIPLLQSTAGQKIPVIMKDAAGAVVLSITGPTITIDKGAGLAAVHDGTWEESAGGLYRITLDATDTNTVGFLVGRVVKAGCVDTFFCGWVRATTEAAVKVSVGTGAGQINVASGKVPATVAAGDDVDAAAVLAKLAGITLLAKWLRGLFRKDAMDATAKAEVNDTGGTFSETTDSLEAQQELAAALATAAELAKVKGAVGGKIVISADGLTVEKYNAAGALLVTLVRTGTGPYTWTPTWA